MNRVALCLQPHGVATGPKVTRIQQKFAPCLLTSVGQQLLGQQFFSKLLKKSYWDNSFSQSTQRVMTKDFLKPNAKTAFFKAILMNRISEITLLDFIASTILSCFIECDNIPVSDSCSAEPTDSPTQNTSFTISTNSMPYATSQSNENTQTAASDSIKQTEAGTESSETSPFTATNPITENETTDGAKSITTDMRSQLSTWTATTSTIESATTENPEGNVKDQLSQLSACDIVGIVIGVLVLLALITLGAFLYVKKRQDAKKSFVYVCTKCGNQSFEMKLVDNNSNNTYATSDTDSSSTEVKQSHVYQNVETSCKMTANVLYDSYQPKGEVETKESECIYAEPDK